MSIVVPLSTTNYGDALSSCGRASEVRPRGQTRFDRFELVHELAGQRPRSREIARERPPARLGALFGGAPEVVENLRDQTLELLDVAAHEQKFALDLLDVRSSAIISLMRRIWRMTGAGYIPCAPWCLPF